MEAVPGGILEMKLLIESAMIFFGTLLAAALLALGEPGDSVVVHSSNANQATQSGSVWHELVAAVQPALNWASQRER